ncbi:MAG: ATP-grasp domain-containing protein [Magnetococcales bacterium]|nr:ATP-grasp domain-containing protein [Magnetococcales bacterium]
MGGRLECRRGIHPPTGRRSSVTPEGRTTGWRSWNVAITGMNAQPDNPAPGMAVARCLRQHPEFHGRLIALGYDALDAGLYHEQSCDEAFLLPYPSMGEAPLLERLQEIHQAVPLDAVIPCLDAELANYQGLQPALEGMGIAAMLPSRCALAARGKERLATLCETAGIETPETRTVNDLSFFDKCHQSGWTYPLVIKGRAIDAQLAYNAEQAKAASWRIAKQYGHSVLVQRFVPGYEVNLSAVCDIESTLLGAVMMRKRATTDKGKAWAGITIEDPELLAMAQTLVSHLSWQGPLEVEALRGDDGKLYLVEINPRFPSWIYLSHAAGRNLPVLLMRLLAKESCPDLPAVKRGTQFIRHAQDVVVDLERWATMVTTGNQTPPPAR